MRAGWANRAILIGFGGADSIAGPFIQQVVFGKQVIEASVADECRVDILAELASGDFETGVPNSNYSSRVKGAIGVSLDDHVLGLKVPHNPRDEQVGGIALLALLVGSEDACRARVAELQGSRYRTCDTDFQLT